MPRPSHVIASLGFLLLTTTFGSSLAFAAQTVHVDLLDKDDGSMAVATSVESVGAGKVTFEVTNTSNDVEHEFLIAQLNGTAAGVPFDESMGVVKEGALKGVTELGDLEPGKLDTMTLDLEAGKYLLFCNMPGHYKAGMYHVLTVTE
jgi:uncharacterized cupredoxin-like copper-binding protein